MAYAGQIIDNPVSGERIEFLRTAADTNGELLEIELTLAADAGWKARTCRFRASVGRVGTDLSASQRREVGWTDWSKRKMFSWS